MLPLETMDHLFWKFGTPQHKMGFRERGASRGQGPRGRMKYGICREGQKEECHDSFWTELWKKLMSMGEDGDRWNGVCIGEEIDRACSDTGASRRSTARPESVSSVFSAS